MFSRCKDVWWPWTTCSFQLDDGTNFSSTISQLSYPAGFQSGCRHHQPLYFPKKTYIYDCVVPPFPQVVIHKHGKNIHFSSEFSTLCYMQSEFVPFPKVGSTNPWHHNYHLSFREAQTTTHHFQVLVHTCYWWKRPRNLSKIRGLFTSFCLAKNFLDCCFVRWWFYLLLCRWCHCHQHNHRFHMEYI